MGVRSTSWNLAAVDKSKGHTVRHLVVYQHMMVAALTSASWRNCSDGICLEVEARYALPKTDGTALTQHPPSHGMALRLLVLTDKSETVKDAGICICVSMQLRTHTHGSCSLISHMNAFINMQ